MDKPLTKKEFNRTLLIIGVFISLAFAIITCHNTIESQKDREIALLRLEFEKEKLQYQKQRFESQKYKSKNCKTK